MRTNAAASEEGTRSRPAHAAVIPGPMTLANNGLPTTTGTMAARARRTGNPREMMYQPCPSAYYSTE